MSLPQQRMTLGNHTHSRIRSLRLTPVQWSLHWRCGRAIAWQEQRHLETTLSSGGRASCLSCCLFGLWCQCSLCNTRTRTHQIHPSREEALVRESVALDARGYRSMARCSRELGLGPLATESGSFGHDSSAWLSWAVVADFGTNYRTEISWIGCWNCWAVLCLFCSLRGILRSILGRLSASIYGNLSWNPHRATPHQNDRLS